MPAMVVWRALCASRGSGGWARKDGVSRERDAECIGARGERGAGVYIYIGMGRKILLFGCLGKELGRSKF